MHVVWVIDDDFLAGDMPFDTQAEHLHHHVAPDIHIEYGRVVVGFVGYPAGKGSQHHRCKAFTKPDCPHASACHTVTSVVQDIEDDEHHYGDDDRHTQSTFADDGSQRCSDKEEQQT